MRNDVEKQLESVLQPGERLLWSGRPCSRLVSDNDALCKILFLLLWTGFLAIWMSHDLGNGDLSEAMGFSIPMTLFGLIALVDIVIFTLWHRSKLFYGLTDQRVLIVGGLLNRTLESMPLKDMNDVTFIEHGDYTGTISFWDFLYSCGEDGDEKCPHEFLRIKDARRVYQLIGDARTKVSYAARASQALA